MGIPTPTSVMRVGLELAKRAHGDIQQKRKYTNEPYVVHPIAVSQALRVRGFSEIVQAAAVCHDVVEDTKVSLEEVVHAIGSEAGRLVWEVTDMYDFVRMSRKWRKAKQVEQIAKISFEAQWIKIEDAYDNAKTIGEYDPSFATVWFQEKIDVGRVLHLVNDTAREKFLADMQAGLDKANAFMEQERMNAWFKKKGATPGRQ